jgi:hypothetical protein
MSEWGNPADLIVSYLLRQGRTGGTETSKYPQERKAKATPLVAASERGPAQTYYLRVAGVWVVIKELKRELLTERSGKFGHRR